VDRKARGELIPFPRQAAEMHPAAPPTDAELILAVLERDDRGAFGELVRRHQSQVRTVLRRLTRGDASLADDLAQEAFVLAWRNLRQFRFQARFSTWLYRIAFNAWQSEVRKKRELLLDLDPDQAPPGSEQAAEIPDIASRVDLERALALLSDGERAAIAACYYADLTHEEAAAALGVPLGTVKTHVMRAKAKLKARLAPKEQA
jgi:RNA polymerase sigma factor (sigma-70 family)